MKESVSEKEVEENDEQVQDFAEDEPAEIYVVPGWWGQFTNAMLETEGYIYQGKTFKNKTKLTCW